MSGETGRCGVCGEDWQLKGDGMLYKHSVQGMVCEGSGKPPEAPDAADAAGDGDTTPDDTTPDDDTTDPDAKQDQPSASPQVRGLGYGQAAFEWHMTVKQPALYLDDVAWHQANGRMAEAEAQRAGHTVQGGGQCTSVTAGDDETTVRLTYTVPVEG